METDGRAGLHESTAHATAERQAQNQQRPSDFRPGPSMAQLPIKTQIALKIQNEGRPDDDSRTNNQSASPAQNTTVKKDYRPGPSMAQLPLKTQIALKMQNGGEGRANGDSNSNQGNSNHPGTTVAQQGQSHAGLTVNGEKRPLSKAEKDSLCKHTGVCLSDLMSSDDPADKVE